MTTETAPIYITIGPQGAGKTSYLSNLKHEQEHQQVKDITIDDQDGVYIPTPIELWLQDQQPSRRNSSEEIASLLQTSIHSKTVSERIYDDNNSHEMRFVIQRLNNIISTHDFRSKISSLNTIGGNAGDVHHCNNKNNIDNKINSNLSLLYKKEGTNHRGAKTNVDWKDILVNVVEEFHRGSSNLMKSDIAQLFIVESIFKTKTLGLSSLLSLLSINDDKNHNAMSGLNAAIEKLNHLAMNERNVPIAWGNTNSQVRDYTTALDAAEKSQRPIVFVPYINDRKSCRIVPIHRCHTHQDGKIDEEVTIIPRVLINELIRRNIQRCYSTGKYVPVKVIIDCCLRVDELIDRAMNEMKTTFQKKNTTSNEGGHVQFTKFEFDFTLAKMAGYHMNDDRTVSRSVLENTKKNQLHFKLPK